MEIDVYVQRIEPVRYGAGEVIFRKNDDGDVMFLVGEGEIELTLEDGRTVPVGPGESFGEMSIIDKHLRSADATAVTDAKVYPISRGLFLVLVHETPHFALEVMKSLTDRLRRANAVHAA
jgi:CRP-like cAMP-binding protein